LVMFTVTNTFMVIFSFFDRDRLCAPSILADPWDQTIGAKR